jgi:hypothetical protein
MYIQSFNGWYMHKTVEIELEFHDHHFVRASRINKIVAIALGTLQVWREVESA